MKLDPVNSGLAFTLPKLLFGGYAAMTVAWVLLAALLVGGKLLGDRNDILGPRAELGAEIDLSNCMNETTIGRRNCCPDPSYDQLRAEALLHTGHIDESIPWFLKALADSEYFYKLELETECAQAYERLGNVDEALKHYGNGNRYYAHQSAVPLLIKHRRFQEAMAICDRAVKEERARNEAYRYAPYDSELCAWLRLKAACEAGMHQNGLALADLRTVATCYAQDNSTLLNECLAEARKLRKRNTSGTDLAIRVTDLPARGKDSLLGLLKYLSTTSKPVDTKAINRLMGTFLHVPGGLFPDSDRQERVSPAVWAISYQTERNHDPARAQILITVWTQNCAIDKETVMAALPPQNIQSSSTYFWGDDEPTKGSEVWICPSGALVLHFADSGFKVLRDIEWMAKDVDRGINPATAYGQTELMKHALDKNDIAAALEHASKAISIAQQETPESYWQLPDCFVQRAEIFARQNQLDLAVADLESAVRTGGYRYLPRKIAFLVEKGRRNEAMRNLEYAIGASKYERERSRFRLSLAKLCLEEKQYSRAISLADECIRSEDQPLYSQKDRTPEYMAFRYETERMSAPAHVIKAKAEVITRKFREARLDAELAASKFFEIARVGYRDKLRAWAKLLPTSEDPN